MVQPLYKEGAGSQLDQDNDFVNFGVFSLSTGEGGSIQEQPNRHKLFKLDVRKKFFYSGHDEAQIAQRCGRCLIPGKIQVQVGEGSGQM